MQFCVFVHLLKRFSQHGECQWRTQTDYQSRKKKWKRAPMEEMIFLIYFLRLLYSDGLVIIFYNFFFSLHIDSFRSKRFPEKCYANAYTLYITSVYGVWIQWHIEEMWVLHSFVHLVCQPIKWKWMLYLLLVKRTK